MNKDVHNNDELFNDAYKRQEETPSTEVWQKLNAALDRKDALYYRSRLKTWRNVAAVLFLLLGMGVVYHFFFAHETNKETAGNNIKDQPVNKNNPLIQQQAASDTCSLLDKVPSINKSSSKINLQNSLPITSNNNLTKNKTRQYSVDNVAGNDSKHIAKKSGITEEPNTSFENKRSGTEKSNVKDTQSVFTTTIQHNQRVLIDSLTRNDDIAKIDSVNQQKDLANSFELKNQSSSNTNIKNKKVKPSTANKNTSASWSILPYVSIEAGGQRLNDDEHHRDPNDPDNYNDIEKREHTEAGFSVGFFLRRSFANKFSLSSGLNYFKYANNIAPQTLYAKRDGNDVAYKLQTSAGYSYITKLGGQTPQQGDSINTNVAGYHLSFLQIPIMAGYHFNLSKKIYLQPAIGVTGNIFLHSRYEAEYEQNNVSNKLNVSKLQGVNPFSLAFIASAELHYQITNRMSLMLMPSFKTAITPITKNNVVNTFPYSAGFGVGLSFNLGN